ncbi:hypothetical protein L218DRAFT_115015 [Marasmius fiardii PR-910]|nr:hypothetical protein L218DRAFT_115015 [Marasmius fiardii PR-910]
MSSTTGATAQDGAWKSKEQGDEARYAHDKEQAQFAALRDQLADKEKTEASKVKDFEGGYGGQEDLEDRYATTSGDH